LRINRRRCILYPEDNRRQNWEIFISFILVVSCIINPLQIAFPGDGKLNGTTMKIIIIGTDSLFLIEIFINFISAHFGDDYNMVDDFKPIAINYSRGWFLIDLIAIIPFEAIASIGINQNH